MKAVISFLGSFCLLLNMVWAQEKSIPHTSYKLDTIRTVTNFVTQLSNRKLVNEHYCNTVISNASVVDVLTGKLMTNQFVVLSHDTISLITPFVDSLPVFPKEKRVLIIDATGKYLAPGLSDMHIHYSCSHYSRLHYLRHGVTTVRVAGGDSLIFLEQQLIKKNLLIGPEVYSTTDVFNTIDTALGSKMQCHTQWVLVGGSIDSVVKSQVLQIEKQGLIPALDILKYPPIKFPVGTVFEQFVKPEQIASQPNANTFLFLSKLITYTHNMKQGSQLDEYSRSTLELIKVYPKQICIGTESGLIGKNYAGRGVLDEMKILNEIGVPDLQILQMATCNAGEMCSVKSSSNNLNSQACQPLSFGCIKEGYLANMVLLSKNPLVSVSNYDSPHSVLSRGIWYSPEDLIEIQNALTNLVK